VQSYAGTRYNVMPPLIGQSNIIQVEGVFGKIVVSQNPRISSTTTERLFRAKIIPWLNTAVFHR